jgi:hypothetical protein
MKTINLIFVCCLSLLVSCDNSTESSDNSLNEVEITVKPVVIKTSTDYNSKLFRTSFPKMELLHEIGEAYQKSYSDNLKKQLISYMIEKADTLGESGEILNECIEVTGCKIESPVSLPTYAERAKYNGEDAWMIQLVWGASPFDLGHYKCFAISMVSKDTLYFKRCK